MAQQLGGCNNGAELQNSGYTHELNTSWWWYAYPCQDVADTTWFFVRGYYRADLSVGTQERLMQTEWLNVKN